MIDVEKYLQSAYDYGYRQGVKDTLDDIHKTLERSLREQFAHLIKTEPNSKVSETPTSSEKPNNCEPKICDTCRYYNSNIPCGSTPSACKEADKFAEEFVDGLKKLKPKDEPQTERSE